MKNRWIVAAAAAGAVALLTVPMLMSGAKEASPRGADSLVASHSGSCPAAEGTAKMDFSLKDHNGAVVKLADYKGKVVLLNFWATWCGPCKMEIPGFIELQEAYRDRGFVIIGVAVEDTPEAVRAFAAEEKMNYPLAMVQEDLEDAYGPIYGLPMSFVIARDGSICKKHLGPVTRDKAEQEIKSLL